MLKQADIKELLGEQNFEAIIKEVDNGSITKDKLKIVAVAMGVHETYDFYKGYRNSELIRYLLDAWFIEKIQAKQDVDAIELMKNILKDDRVNLQYLANRLSHISTTTQTNVTKKIKTNLPKKFADSFTLQAPPAQPATWSDQGKESTCTKHSVGKAIVAILDGYGLDCDQEKVIAELGDKCPRFPSEFNEKRMKVWVTEKEGDKEAGEIEIEVHVTTGETYMENHIWKQKLQECSDSMRMVITWDMTTAKDKMPVTHCLFCKKVSDDKKTFYCLNSWGEFNEQTPEVPSMRVCAVDYVSICEV